MTNKLSDFKNNNDSLPKLKMLIVIVNRDMGDVYLNMLQDFEVTAQILCAANGTASEKALQKLGVGTAKAVILAALREDRAEDALNYLEDRFKTIRNGKGIAFTVPFASVIGVATYKYLSNQPGEV